MTITYCALMSLMRHEDIKISELARRTGIADKTLRRKFAGETDWTVSEIYAIALVLDICREEVGDYWFADRDGLYLLSAKEYKGYRTLWRSAEHRPEEVTQDD